MSMRFILLILLSASLAGCQSRQPQEAIVARVGSYVITKDEFEESYKNSAYGRQHDKLYRSSFLNNMINQKLILLDSQRRGLDRDPQFLKMVETFWQQSLLTMALQEKTKEGGNLDAWMGYLKDHTKIEINQEYLQ